MFYVNTGSLGDTKFSIIGQVEGDVVYSANVIIHFFEYIRGMFGGEMANFTAQNYEARAIAQQRMGKKAEKLGADGIINVRYSTSKPAAFVTGVVAIGTAVKVTEWGNVFTEEAANANTQIEIFDVEEDDEEE